MVRPLILKLLRLRGIERSDGYGRLWIVVRPFASSEDQGTQEDHQHDKCRATAADQEPGRFPGDVLQQRWHCARRGSVNLGINLDDGRSLCRDSILYLVRDGLGLG